MGAVGRETEQVPEGPPLSPLGAEPIEVDGAEQAQEEGAMVKDDATVEQADSSAS